jgi:hypothetical protein
MKKLHPIVMLLACLFITELLTAQDSLNKMFSLPTWFIESINKKTSRIENHNISTSERALNQLLKQELRLQKKLHKKDTLLAKQLFDNAV